jgi:2-hydroxy-6-oxonona-2,4-dienedioate hydrolase
MGLDMSKITEQSTSRTVDANGLRVHYHDVGEGDPIIAIHGGGPGATAWSNFKGNIAGLAANNRLLMFDMPGWGRTEYPEGAEKEEFIGWCGRVLKDFMDALGIDKADVIGNSMAAWRCSSPSASSTWS